MLEIESFTLSHEAQVIRCLAEPEKTANFTVRWHTQNIAGGKRMGQ